MSSQPRSSGGTAAPASMRSFLARREKALLWCLAIAAAGLGYVGICRHLESLGKPYDALDIVYYLVQLFIFRTGLGMESHEVHWTLRVARLLAPMVLGYAALKGLASVFREQLVGLRMSFLCKHVVVCGLGDKGLQLVRDLRGRRLPVVVIESDGENREIATARGLGALVVTGNATDEATLLRARVGHARILLAFTGDDGVNVEIVLAAHRLFAKRKRPPSSLRCFMHLYDTNFAAVVRHHPAFAKSQTGLDLQVVRTSSICARMLFEEFPLDVAQDPARAFRQPHLIIAGFGNMGECLAIQAAHVGQFAGGRRIRITVVDLKAHYTESLFLATYPAFAETADIEFIECDIQSGVFFEKVQRWAAEAGARATLVISIHDDTKAFACAHHCVNRTPGATFPVHVRLDTNKGFASLLRDIGNKAAPPREPHPEVDSRLQRMHPFGMLDACCTLDKIEDVSSDRLARAIHERYIKTRKAPEQPGQLPPARPGEQDNDPSLRPWDELDDKLKDSNRWQADHIAVKLRAVGCQAGMPDPAKAARRVTAFADSEIEVLAVMEHERWCAERRLDGWRPGKVKDTENLVTPYLVRWDDLDPNVQRYDIETVKFIPELLESVGKWLYRECEPCCEKQARPG
jgi:voltage-gated potassium channel Kch